MSVAPSSSAGVAATAPTDERGAHREGGTHAVLQVLHHKRVPPRGAVQGDGGRRLQRPGGQRAAQGVQQPHQSGAGRLLHHPLLVRAPHTPTPLGAYASPASPSRCAWAERRRHGWDWVVRCVDSWFNISRRPDWVATRLFFQARALASKKNTVRRAGDAPRRPHRPFRHESHVTSLRTCMFPRRLMRWCVRAHARRAIVNAR